MASEGAGVKAGAVDTQLFSRQLAALDFETQRRIMSTSVLLLGVQGLGAEIAKNLVLMGVKALTMCDSEPATLQDLVSHFYLTPGDVGKPRAVTCLKRFADLNRYVHVEAADYSDALVALHDVVILCGGTLTQALHLDALCRGFDTADGPAKKFLWCGVNGVFTYLFNDFGASHEVLDRDGEQPKSYMVSSISQDVKSVVTLPDDPESPRLELDDGALVSFSGVEGMVEANTSEKQPKYFRITKSGTHTLSIGDTSGFHAYTCGGYMTEVKEPVTLHFDPIEKQLTGVPSLFCCDDSKPARERQLYAAYRTLWEYQRRNGRIPALRCQEDAKAFWALALEVVPKAGVDATLDEKLFTTFALVAGGDMSPMDTIWGGIVAHEAVKAASGKYTPVRQWAFLDYVEALPDKELPAEEFSPLGGRYDRQIALIGRTMQEMLGCVNIFLVGAGAIGCEILKVWAMMGLACGPDGMVHVTDMDTIEKSNLSRQFLFNASHVNKSKAKIAAAAVVVMNPDLKVKDYVLRVGEETASIFNDAFYENIHAICAALDNVKARSFLDQKCIAYKKPFIEGGTQGPKGSTTVVVPNMTESYTTSGIRDPPEKEFPLCTIHNFPNAIEHTIAWGRNLFEGLFVNPPCDVLAYLANPDFFKTIEQPVERLEKVEHVHHYLVEARPKSFTDCLLWGRMQFEEKFTNNIKNLLSKFPPDALAEGGKALFWSPPKRCPTVPIFDLRNQTHRTFVLACAHVRAHIFGVAAVNLTDHEFDALMERIVVPEWKESDPRADDDTTAKERGLLVQLPAPAEVTFKPRTVVFEKDDDTNHHIAFITAASNLRAESYKIPPADFHKTKVIAGKIIPALITTTAVVSGIQCAELLKTAYGDKPITAYRNVFLNLALPFFAFQEPQPASEDLWKDEVVYDVPDETAGAFVERMHREHQWTVSSVVYGVKMVFASWTLAKCRDTKLSVLAGPLAPGETELVVSVIFDEDPGSATIRVLSQ
eukprot:TRINITY_DN4492_c0_g1_i1.p1 TRINITY_DN4492_c0_g1~~TRINITY_DN4492_c0_g1_i1.p1  ORF type:complete len:1005 (-),score=301.24 TRINITY_DN4492_c0_g1_i1:1386-4364(-)